MNAHDHTHRCLACSAAWACRNTCGGPGEVVLDECAACTAQHPPSRRFLEGYLILVGVPLGEARGIAATKAWMCELRAHCELRQVPYLHAAAEWRASSLGWKKDPPGEAPAAETRWTWGSASPAPS